MVCARPVQVPKPVRAPGPTVPGCRRCGPREPWFPPDVRGRRRGGRRGRGPSGRPAYFARARAPGDRRERYPSWPRLPPLLSWHQDEVAEGLIARNRRKEDFISTTEDEARITHLHTRN